MGLASYTKILGNKFNLATPCVFVFVSPKNLLQSIPTSYSLCISGGRPVFHLRNQAVFKLRLLYGPLPF